MTARQRSSNLGRLGTTLCTLALLCHTLGGLLLTPLFGVLSPADPAGVICHAGNATSDPGSTPARHPTNCPLCPFCLAASLQALSPAPPAVPTPRMAAATARPGTAPAVSVSAPRVAARARAPPPIA